MKNSILNRTFLLILVIGAITMQSCDDKWDEHYSTPPTDGADQTMLEYINSQPDLSTFASMLEATGYDSIINTSQSYTIWAPSNDALAALDLNDEALITNTVENHITRSRITTSGISSKTILMNSNKNVIFSANGSGYSFGESMLSEENIPVSNGLIHKLEGYAPYLYNIWEYLGNIDDVDSVGNYLYSYDELEFDPKNSIEIGYNDSLQPIYDSIFIYSNAILSAIGELYTEDSVYTAIVPNNDAWMEAFDRISPFYNVPDEFGGEVRQGELTRINIVKDMVFRGRVDANQAGDSLVSTIGTVFHNPSYLFNNSVKNNASNGYVYQTSQMPFIDTASWFNERKIEAEYSFYRDDKNAAVFNRTSYGSDLDVSNNRYILVTPFSPTAKPICTFTIPSILSAKYNIYCVFVPESIVDETKLLKSKVSFVLTYVRNDGGRTKRLALKSDDYVIQEEGLTKMLVTEFEFEFAHLSDVENEAIEVTLEVINTVTNAEGTEENAEFTRNMRIDAIVFEPVTD